MLFLSGCGGAETGSGSADGSPPELEKTDRLVVSADAKVFDLDGSFDDPNFEYVFNHTDTAPPDQLIAFTLAADAASGRACEDLRSRFLEVPTQCWPVWS